MIGDVRYSRKMSDTFSIATAFTLMLAASAFPGPSDMLVVVSALQTGLRGSSRVIFGIILGDALFVLAACVGLSSLNRIFPGASILMKNIGITVLLIMGFRMIWSTRRMGSPQPRTNALGIRAGFLVTMADPTAVAFYAAILPILTQEQPMGLRIGIQLFLTAVLAILIVKSIYTFTALKLKDTILRPEWKHHTQRLAAVAFFLLALWTALQEYT